VTSAQGTRATGASTITQVSGKRLDADIGLRRKAASSLEFNCWATPLVKMKGAAISDGSNSVTAQSNALTT